MNFVIFEINNKSVETTGSEIILVKMLLSSNCKQNKLKAIQRNIH